MSYGADKDALALLLAVKEHHDRLSPEEPIYEGTPLAPELVAEGAGLEPGTLRYERAVEDLVREGDLGREERLGGVLLGVHFYRITSRGLEMLGAT